MSTRSFVGIMGKDGRVRGVSCNWDGYPEGVGRILKEHYSSVHLPLELIGLGSLSSVGPRLWPEPKEQHSFDHPARGVTVAYHRDRGEPWEPPREYISLKAAIEYIGRDYGAQWLYVWDGVNWDVYQAAQWVY